MRTMFLLVESIIEIRGKQFSKKELIIAAGQLIFWLVETIFVCVCVGVCVCVFFRDSCQWKFFFCLVEQMFQENPSG